MLFLFQINLKEYAWHKFRIYLILAIYYKNALFYLLRADSRNSLAFLF